MSSDPHNERYMNVSNIRQTIGGLFLLLRLHLLTVVPVALDT